MNIHNIGSFLLLAKYLNFAKVADMEHVNQSTMSRKIETLEKELGVVLFNRDSRNVTLTEAGKEFYFQAAKLLEQYNMTVEFVQNAASGFQRELRIGIGLYEQFFLSRFLSDYIKAYPRIKISLFQFPYQQLLEQFSRGNLDIIFTSDQFISSGTLQKYENALICNKPWNVAVHKDMPIANCQQLTNKMIGDYVLISMHNGSVNQIRNIYKSQGVTESFRDIIHVNSYEAKLTLVNAGVGVCFLPAFVLAKNFGNVVLKKLSPYYIPRNFYAMCEKDSLNGSIEEMFKQCLASCKDLQDPVVQK